MKGEIIEHNQNFQKKNSNNLSKFYIHPADTSYLDCTEMEADADADKLLCRTQYFTLILFNVIR